MTNCPPTSPSNKQTPAPVPFHERDWGFLGIFTLIFGVAIAIMAVFLLPLYMISGPPFVMPTTSEVLTVRRVSIHKDFREGMPLHVVSIDYEVAIGIRTNR